MRRSFGGLLESKGVPVTDIQRAMRHSNVGTTSVYLDKNPAKAAAITGALTIGGL
jgi:integrase